MYPISCELESSGRWKGSDFRMITNQAPMEQAPANDDVLKRLCQSVNREEQPLLPLHPCANASLMWCWVAFLLVASTGCEPAGDVPPSASRAAPIVPMDTGLVHIISAGDTTRVRVEIAETPQTTRIGLMDRDSMGPDEGMIFLMD